MGTRWNDRILLFFDEKTSTPDISKKYYPFAEPIWLKLKHRIFYKNEHPSCDLWKLNCLKGMHWIKRLNKLFVHTRRKSIGFAITHSLKNLQKRIIWQGFAFIFIFDRFVTSCNHALRNIQTIYEEFFLNILVSLRKWYHNKWNTSTPLNTSTPPNV